MKEGKYEHIIYAEKKLTCSYIMYPLSINVEIAKKETRKKSKGVSKRKKKKPNLTVQCNEKPFTHSTSVIT